MGEFVVAGLAVLIVAPGFALLYFLQQRRVLTAAESDADLRLAAQLEQAPPSQPARGRAGADPDPDDEGAGVGRAGHQGDQECVLTLTPPVTAVTAPLRDGILSHGEEREGR